MVAAPLMNAWMEKSRAGAVGTRDVHLFMLMADGTHRGGWWQVTLSFLTRGLFPQICWTFVGEVIS